MNQRLGVPFHNYYKGPRWSHAKYWDNIARQVGVRVDKKPAVGAVAQWNRGTYGHVAWVARVNSDGTVLLEEYNRGGTSKYSTRTVARPVAVVDHGRIVEIGSHHTLLDRDGRYAALAA